MRRATFLTSAAALLFMGSTAFAQAKPNFAGKWTLLPDTGMAGQMMGGGQMGGLGGEATIVQDEKTLSITRAGPNGAPFTSVFSLDGTEMKQSLDVGGGNMISLTLKGQWKDKQFLTSTWADMQGQGFEILLSFSLDDKGNLVTEHTTPAMGGNSPGGTLVYHYKKGS